MFALCDRKADPFAQEIQKDFLLLSQLLGRVGIVGANTASNLFEHSSAHVGVEDCGMHVTLFADGGCIAEPGCYGFNGLHYVSFGLGLRLESFKLV
jgi:hypothetical protein